jgi:cytochrome c553
MFMLPSMFRPWGYLFAAAVAAILPAATAAPFFDPTMPVYGSPVDGGEAGVIARGLLIRAGEDDWVVFDQDLLRPALWVRPGNAKPPISLVLMSQASWEKPTQKGGVALPVADPGSVMLSPALPGVGKALEDLTKDPRPVHGNDPGRGGLEASGRRFLGHQVAGRSGVLHYDCGGTLVREWYEADRKGMRRHLAVAPGEELLLLLAAGDFQTGPSGGAGSAKLNIVANHAGLKLEVREGKLFGRLSPSKQERRVTLSYGTEKVASAGKTLAVPTTSGARWTQAADAKIDESARSGPGWVIDRIGLPVNNAFKRRVRPADLVFLAPDKAAVVTFEGDVWRLNLSGSRVRWTRIAAGLSEPLSIEQVGGVVQVFTRNGIIRLRDTNNDGETDFYENHSSLVHHTTGTRGYPLDMEVDGEGRTWCSTGGIVTGDKSLTNQAPANPHAGAIMMISADGKKLEIVGSHAREPFFGRDPVSGRIMMSEQQGNWVPSSGIFPVTPGANFGYGSESSGRTLPAVWIPHDQDRSSASPMWVRDSAFKAWEGGLLDLSYGTGRLFLVRPAESSTEGAVIPLGIDTGLPVLHARVHPGDGSIWLAGFRIYDSGAPDLEGIARLRPSREPLVVPVDARVVKDVVVISFAAELDPASVTAETVQAKEWQYKRSSGYGSPRLKRDGKTGADPVATGATLLSKDRKKVFIHIPGMKRTMQLEISHGFVVKGAKAGVNSVYFTVRDASPAADWAALGFEAPTLDASLAKVHGAKAADAKPSEDWGKELSARYGCIACHSIDGAKEGHSGPTWKGLHGAPRRFTNGKSATADDAYLTESILEPGKTIVEGYSLGMGSYSGILSEPEIQSILLYIRSLK